MYSCPFRVMQFDTITCEKRYVLTCVCCFSRWVWLVPISDKSAENIAKGLMRIFCDAGSFPTVLRSDNASEFVGRIVTSLNKMLEIKHITGSAYHPQSQGQGESMHRTLNQVVRAIVDGRPDDYEDALMYAQMILRSAPMGCLGGRSPYEYEIDRFGVDGRVRLKYADGAAQHQMKWVDLSTCEYRWLR